MSRPLLTSRVYRVHTLCVAPQFLMDGESAGKVHLAVDFRFILLKKAKINGELMVNLTCWGYHRWTPWENLETYADVIKRHKSLKDEDENERRNWNF